MEYAGRILVRLARSAPGESLSAERISDLENIPRAYVGQIFQRLRHAGLVESLRGAHGGYILAGNPREVTMAMVVRAVEGGLLDNVCEKYSEGEQRCNHKSNCDLRPVWRRLAGIIEGFLGRVTLADLAAVHPPHGGRKVCNCAKRY